MLKWLWKGCFSCTEKYRQAQEYNEMVEQLQCGMAFDKKKFTFGLLGSGSEQITLSLNDKQDKLLWFRTQDPKEKRHEICLNSIKTLSPQGQKAFTILSTQGDTLLELTAAETDDRDFWVTSIQLVCEKYNQTHNKKPSSSNPAQRLKQAVKEKAAKQQYWQSRQQELAARKEQAEEKKKKFATVGMKYTAIALSNRSSN